MNLLLRGLGEKAEAEVACWPCSFNGWGVASGTVRPQGQVPTSIMGSWKRL